MWLMHAFDQWNPLECSQQIERAFQEGHTEIRVRGNLAIFSQMMIYTEATGDRVNPLARQLGNNEDPTRWLISQDTEFIQMPKQHSAVLNVARRHRYDKICLHTFPLPASFMTVNLNKFEAVNENGTGSARQFYLVPAPSDEKLPSTNINGPIPAEFCCPITTDIMHDPVVAEDGFTYERSAIERWMVQGNMTSPMTKEDFSPHRLPYPNFILKQLITEFVSESSNIRNESDSGQSRRSKRARADCG